MTFIFIPPGLYFLSLEQHLPQFFTLNKPVLAGTTSLRALPPPRLECASYGFPYHHLAGPCQSQFVHCTLGGRPARPCKIRPRDTERLYFGPNVSKPHGRRRRRHSDCGPSFSPIFHLRVNSRGLSEVATREMRRSVLLRLHLNRREHDRALLRGLDCRVHVFQTSFGLLDRDHIPYYKPIYYGSIGQAASGISLCRLCVVSYSTYVITSRVRAPSLQHSKSEGSNGLQE
ncbi:unnamed protein product [Penicillium nalgiovense]|nr:unnamed protein product [Penicillium nalgiovense]CAG8126903.1 unnamed protein product [Penicillium nalgiovense]